MDNIPGNTSYVPDKTSALPIEHHGHSLLYEIPKTDKVRTFETGATRSQDKGRPDYEGYLSPLVIERFGEYMLKHQVQSDGTIRSSDNWQRGITLDSYIKGAFRHFMHWWQRHRGWPVRDPHAAADVEEDICALIFNCQGYLHEILKRK